MNTPQFTLRLIGSLLLLAGADAQAAEPPADSKPPLWEVGVVGVGLSQLAYPGANQHVSKALPLPFLIYRGEYWRADDEGAGLRAIRTERFELDVSFSGSLGAGGSDKLEAREGMAKLGTLIEFGPVGRWRLNDPKAKDRWTLELPLRAVFDVSHSGAHRGMSFEPELGFEHRVKRGWSYSASLSAYTADRRLGSTFYGVAPSEALPDRAAYSARRGLVAWRLSGALSRDLSTDFKAFGFLRVESVAGAANRASPLVKQTTGATIGLGLAYTWQRSEARAAY